jgi:ketosteroid isomerase-like protein
MSQQTLQAARGLYEAFNRGDLNAFERACARQFEWNEADNSLNAGGNPYRNFAQVLEGVFKPTMRDFEDFRVDLEQLHDAGATIVGTGRYRGRHKDTGRQLSAQFCHVMHFDHETLLDRVQEYADTLAEAEVAGRAQQIEIARIPQAIM